MPFSVADFLNIPIIRRGKVRTAVQTLSGRAIEFISVIELPVENFVRKNELVLSTAIGCNHALEIFMDFIRDICRSEAAALVIATGRHVTRIPPQVLHYAEARQFPIIEIPWDIRFAEIIEAVLTKLQKVRQNRLKRFDTLQQQLFQLYLSGATLAEAAEQVHRALNTPVALINTIGTLKGCSRDGAGLAALGVPPAGQTVKEQTDAALPTGQSSVMFFKIQSGNRLHGYLIINSSAKKRNAPDHNRISAGMSRILATIALWFHREQAGYEAELNRKDDFVWSLAKGELEPWDAVLVSSRSMGYDLSLPYVCIIGQFSHTTAVYRQKGAYYANAEQWQRDLITSVKEQIFWAGTALGRKTMTTCRQERFIIFLETADQADLGVNQFLDQLEDRLKKNLPEILLSWGIGENHAGIKTFHESYRDATTALEAGYRQQGPSRRSTCRNTGICRMLALLGGHSEVKEITTAVIRPLVAYDYKRGLDLINTLKIYMDNRGNVSQTARMLHLHRQSLLYRLKKIETLTSRSLENRDDLFLLDLCLRLWVNEKGIIRQTD